MAIDCHSRTIRPLVFCQTIYLQSSIENLSVKCIGEHDKPRFCVNPLTVAEGKKLRLVIDLRHVNQYLVKPKFKYEDLRSLSQVLQTNSWFFTWDLKSGYHHVDITAEHQQYLSLVFIYRNSSVIYCLGSLKEKMISETQKILSTDR